MRLKPIRGKRGNFPDLVILPALLFATALALFLIYYIYNQIQSPLAGNLNSTYSNANNLLNQGNEALKLFDTLYPMYMAGLILAVLISAYFVRSYPFFFFAGVIVLVVSILLGVLLANIHATMIRENTATFGAYADDFSSIDWIINRLPFIILFTGLAIIILIYSKPAGNQFSGGI